MCTNHAVALPTSPSVHAITGGVLTDMIHYYRHYLSTLFRRSSPVSMDLRSSSTPLTTQAMKDLVRRGRSKSVVDHTKVPPVHSLTSPRVAGLPMVKFPLGPLRRRDDPNEPPVHTKSPLLTLKLSSRSFLDSTIGDGTLRGPLYDIKTDGASTTVLLNDHRRFSVKVATIHWPRVLPTKTAGKDYTDGVQIQFRGTHFLGGETLLKHGTNPK